MCFLAMNVLFYPLLYTFSENPNSQLTHMQVVLVSITCNPNLLPYVNVDCWDSSSENSISICPSLLNKLVLMHLSICSHLYEFSRKPGRE